jgi:hypothetical protein
MVEIAGRYARQVLYSVVAAAPAAIVGLTQLGALSAPWRSQPSALRWAW